MRTWLLCAGVVGLAACNLVSENSSSTDSRGVDARTVSADDCYELTPKLGAKQQASERGALGRVARPECGQKGPAAEPQGRAAEPAAQTGHDYTRFRRIRGSERYPIASLPQEQGASASGASSGATSTSPATPTGQPQK